jgi:outer membrane protein assembly factor BamB/tetratricopeptide (TPR) repeat protein
VAFQGDAAQIPLTSILQAMTLNGQEGVLTLQCAAFNRRVRLLKQGLRPLNFTSNPPDLLREVLLKQKLLTEAQFQNILSTWKAEKSYAGDFLLRRRILSQEDLEGGLRKHLEDVLLDIFLVPDLQYEFKVGEHGEPLEMFSPDGPGSCLVFNVNSLLMEAARREDDWKRFRTAIPDDREIFTIVPGADFERQRLGIVPEHLRTIRPLLNGERSVRAIIGSSALSTFEVHAVLFSLKEAGLIRPLSVEAKTDLAEKLRRSLRIEEALSIYGSILLAQPQDVETRLKIVAMTEGMEGREADLLDHHLALARAYEESDPDRCAAHLEKAIKLAPHHLVALEGLFRISYQRDRQKIALDALKAGIVAARAAGRAQQAMLLVQRLLAAYPKEPALYHELADAAFTAGDIPKAIAHLCSAAEIYHDQGDTIRLHRVIEKVSRFDPDEASRLKRRTLPEGRRSPIPRLLKVGAATTGLAGLLAAGILFTLGEYYARTAYAHIAEDLEVHKRHGAFDTGIRALEDFGEAFPLSLRNGSAKDIVQALGKLAERERAAAKEDLETRARKAESELLRAQIHVTKDEYEKALEVLEAVEASRLPPERAKQHATLRAQLSQYRARALNLLERAKAARETEDLKQSHALLRELLARYPFSASAREIRMPVFIDTTPPGADVQVGGQTAGKTPGVFEFRPGSNLRSVLLVKEGYAPVDLMRTLVDGRPFDPVETCRVAVALEKTVVWELAVGAPVECTPLALDTSLFVASRGGDVLRAHLASGEIVWRTTLPSKMDVTGALGAWNNLLYFGCFDGKIYVLDASTGQLARHPVEASPEGHPIKAPPSAASETGLVVFNCGERLLAGYSLTSGSVRWATSFADARILGQPQIDKDAVYVASQQGTLYCVDLESGVVRRQADMKTKGVGPAVLSDGHAFYASASGTVTAFDLLAWEPAWSHDCGGQAGGLLTADGGLLFVPLSSGKLVCLATDGEPKWHGEVGGVLAAGGVVFRNTLLAGTRDGKVVCIDTRSGKVRWSFNSSGPTGKERGMVARGLVSQGRFFIGSEGHSLYSFLLD